MERGPPHSASPPSPRRRRPAALLPAPPPCPPPPPGVPPVGRCERLPGKRCSSSGSPVSPLHQPGFPPASAAAFGGRSTGPSAGSAAAPPPPGPRRRAVRAPQRRSSAAAASLRAGAGSHPRRDRSVSSTHAKVCAESFNASLFLRPLFAAAASGGSPSRGRLPGGKGLIPLPPLGPTPLRKSGWWWRRG